jgi:hypothetical protein
MAATITYRKTKQGEWVAFGPVDALHVGQVTVSKKSGETKTETVVRLGRVFQVAGADMVYGYLAPAAPSHSHRSLGDCNECGERRAVTTALDSSGIAGAVCGRCARMSQYERSFC